MWISSTGFVTGQKIGVGKWTYNLYRSVITLLYAQHSKIELNGTQSNSIRGLSTIEFGNRTKSNTRLSVSSISEQIELETERKPNSIEHNLMDWVRLALVNLYKASPSKQVFLALFYNLFNNRNSIYKPSTAVKKTEQNRTEQSFYYSRGRIPKLLYPFLV